MAWYELKLQADGDEWLVTAPAFPEVTTFGEDHEAACRNGRAAIEEAIAGRIADSEAIPVPMLDTPPKGFFVQMSLMVTLKSALYMILRDNGQTRADLMRLLGWHREQVDRLFRLEHNSTLDQLEKAFAALGVTLRVDIPFPKAA